MAGPNSPLTRSPPRMKFAPLLGLFLAAVTVLAESAPPPASTGATAAITELRTGLIDSFEKGDIDRLVSYLDPNVIVTWQNGEVCQGPEGVRAFYARMMTGDHRVVREIRSQPEVIGRHVYGNWAVSWGNLHDTFVLADGRRLPLNSVFTATIAQRGDRWLVTGFHASVNAFDNAILRRGIRKTALWTTVIVGVIGLAIGWWGGRRRKPATA